VRGLCTKHLPLSVATVFGGVGEQAQIRALRSATDIVIACPGRLLDLMGRRCADFTGLQFLCSTKPTGCSTWVSCRTSGALCQQLPKQRQTLMFSATLSREIESLTHEFQRSRK